MWRFRTPVAGRVASDVRLLGLLALSALLVGAASREAAGQPASGPLRVHPTNPRYFADATGKVVYLTGSHHWENLQDVGDSNPPPTFDYTGYLDTLSALRHNFFRLWRWEQARWGSWNGIDELRYGPHPYPRTGPGTALDGGLKFNLNQFNQAYFDRMRQRIQQAGARGIYVSVMLFDGWSMESKALWGLNPWRGHPFHASNNINGINGDPNNDGEGLETHDLRVAAITALQEAYVRKVVDTVNDLDNVLYEISNESSWQSTAWQYHMIQYVKTYESTKPKQHPVGMTAQYPWQNGDRETANTALINSPADWISPAGEPFRRPAATGNKVILADTDHLCGICGDRTFVWRSFVNGENPLFMDVWSCDAWWYPADCDRPTWPSLRQNLGYTRDYANRINLVSMVPRPDLSSTFNVLARAVSSGAEYLVYQPSSGSFTVNLSDTPAQLTVEWFNPATGQAQAGSTVTGGGQRTFTPPFGGDAVLYLRDAGGVTPPSPPTITSVNPITGPTTGGQLVTINGTALSGASSVTFDGLPATITSNSATSITATAPARTAGVVSVAVTTAGGTASLPGAYTFVSTPTISGVTPAVGPTTGGQEVTISGASLSGASSVTFGGVPAAITDVSPSTVTVTTPARAAGVVNVVVTATGGTATRTNAYTYRAAPTISGLSPSSGPMAGGGTVVISGTNLTGILAVTVGGAAATVTGNTSSTVTVTTPPGIAGPAAVGVTTAGGTATAAGAYTYLVAPTITSVSPASGGTNGGHSVTISGTNLGGATSVTFGGTVAPITANSATSVTVTTPARTAGSVAVIVSALAGTATASNAYTYVATPTITSVGPSTGPTSGGQSVTITGTNLSGATSVTFGGTSAAITSNSASSVVVVTPARAAGAVNVVVNTAAGAATAANGYTYGATPALSSITPSTGPASGGQTVTLSGANLSGASAVTFGGTAATIVGNTATTITITTPGRSAGTVAVAVTTSQGTASIANAYTFVAAPAITSLSPSSGSSAGGMSVTITGSNLSNASSVTFGGAAAAITGNSASTVTVTAPARPAGAAPVLVTTPGGTATTTFTYLSTPTITSVSPNSGSPAGGQTVTISGTNLAAATSVTIGASVATITAVTATSVTVTTPPGSGGGPVDVRVVTPGGTAVAAKAFNYQSGSPSRPRGVKVQTGS